ncbi:MAG: sigma-54 dependent transcriptional regulator [Proteobacteria bacterium]|nr:sigma-54 dependent transcriptional regulator [Pseudomonadota bacterium]
MARVLIVDDELNIRQMLKTILEKHNYSVDLAENGNIAFEKVKNNIYDIVLCDIKMPVIDGFEFLNLLKENDINLTVIMMTAYGSIDTAVSAIRAGAYDYISKPFKADEVIIAIKKAEERERLIKENIILKKQSDQKILENIVCESKEMKDILNTIEKIAPYRQPVLITGESGVGKEIVARLIHEKSPRAKHPFVAINCAAIPENLLESELFGHTKGAFTDAVRPKRGLLEHADGGTCFLDEISEMQEALQGKLLRFLEDGEIRRIGDVNPIKVDVRIISATNKNLQQLIEEGKFRLDLFYRLNVIPINIPPLRDRKEDILAYVNRELKNRNITITDEALNVLLNYSWPGNFRELKNFFERLFIFLDKKVIDINDIPEYMINIDTTEIRPDAKFVSLKRAIEELEKDYIKRALILTKGNKLKAAKLLEISPRGLHYKLKEYNIE